MATIAPVLPPPAPVAQEAVVQHENAAEAPFASAQAPSLHTDALDEAMPEADATAAKEAEPVKEPADAPASVPQQSGTSAGAEPDRAEPYSQPAVPTASEPAPTPMDADPTPPAGISSAPGPAEEAASAAAANAPATEANGVSATVHEPVATVVQPGKPASAPAAATMNGTAKANGSSSAAGPAAKGAAAVDSDSEDDVPLARRIVTPPSKPAKPALVGGEKKKRPLENGASKPAAKKARPDAPRPPKPEAKPAKQKQPKPQEDGRSRERRRDDAPKRTAERSSSRARASGDDSSGQGAKSENREKKWETLVHAGILFPPEYEPHGVRMLYEGKPVELTTEQEELATMIAVMKETDYMKKPTFLKNAWAAFKEVLGKGHTIRGLEKCDFTPIYEHYMAKKEADKARSKEEKLAAKEEKQAKEAKYTFALVDGRQEQVGNFRVEPPGLFRGRGEHPKMGKYKRRIYPRDVTINVGKGVHIEVPEPYRSQGQKWKEVRHDNTVTWLAYWKDPVNDSQYKYVWLAANSTFKSDSDLAKYEKARKLKDFIGPIREAYEKDWASASVASQQMAVALYFIDVLALRAGHEKEEDEADTVGCCTLKVENVECIEPSTIKFDFLGKDSVPYENTVEVKPPVFRNVRRWIRKDAGGANKRPGDQLFDTFDANDLNKRLRELMDGLSAKVFRTYNASVTLDRLLWSNEDGTPGDGIAEDGTVDAKKASYDRANKEVAILCNHQKAVGKGHDGAMEKLQEKLKDAKHQLKDLHTSGGSDAKIAAKQKQVARLELSAKVKEDLKNVALGTSKINYMDPRITVAWCKRNEVPMEKIFNKSLLSKFAWAMDVEPLFRF